MHTFRRNLKAFIDSLLSWVKMGAISRSSKFVVKNSLKHIKGPVQTIVEYGPGDGVMTRSLLGILAPEGKLIIIESNPQFVKLLRRVNDPRLEIIEGNIEDVIDSGNFPYHNVDLVFSSIPFSFLDAESQDQVIARTHEILGPSGSLIIFHQYSTQIKKTLKKYFSEISVIFEPRNIFPCFILFAKKTENSV